mmetsp:Transcript_16032/g.24048  ORF Transcript_16032/g.24048 Transcript_16032/m.24048 type:complete len:228 (-) Transcript_16032:809-1492(-)
MEELSFRDQVRAYYEQHNPEKLSSLDEIVRKFSGREADLWKKLRKKYAPSRPLDFRSESFDALLALNTPNLLPPIPSAPTLDNISKFRHLLPCDSEQFEARVSSHATGSKSVNNPSSSSSRGRSLINTIIDPVRHGPLSLLWRALQERRRILVKIRGAKMSKIRGSCQGLLKAFDRHMNMFLVDVIETFLPPTATRKQRSSNFQVSRRLPNLFIRGDNIISVSFVVL